MWFDYPKRNFCADFEWTSLDYTQDTQIRKKILLIDSIIKNLYWKYCAYNRLWFFKSCKYCACQNKDVWFTLWATSQTHANICSGAGSSKNGVIMDKIEENVWYRLVFPLKQLVQRLVYSIPSQEGESSRIEGFQEMKHFYFIKVSADRLDCRVIVR